jgi:hypothetical protein
LADFVEHHARAVAVLHAGKKVKGRKLHALVDVEGLPLRVVVHSAGMQDRDGTGVVLDKIRQRFPWLELVNAGARLHRFPEQRCINDADEKALEHGLVSWASSWGQIVFGRVGVVAA